ncbi:MAG: protein kinase [Polyangiales bacterium]
MFDAPHVQARMRGDAAGEDAVASLNGPRSGRFEIVRQLGRGGMGIVFEAYDSVRGLNVALKVIPDASPRGLLAIKREFRVLADLQHPNLVRLLDLVVDAHGSFFTMELVDGEDFIEYTAPKATGGVMDYARLRRTLEQLTRGLAVLHGNGLVHRDVKPSNCLVSRGGRVVVLDFGLVQPFAAKAAPAPGPIVGTIDYMAPEQARGESTLGAAVDWYAVGVMLYQALAGAHPFDGHPMGVMVAKMIGDPRPISELVPDCPPDLARLTMALLARDPSERPTASEIFDCLTGTHALPLPVRRPVDLLERDRELSAVHEAFTRVSSGRGAIVVVRGASGAGKSALVASALRLFGAGTRSLALDGRCYPREAVAFNAFDRIIDQLVTALPTRAPHLVGDIGWEDANALVSIFPALGALFAGRTVDGRGAGAEGGVYARDRGFRALRKLLGALAAHGPIVLAIDDVQWADADSLALLGALANAPALSGVAIVVSYREDEQALPSAASVLRRALADASLRWDSLDLELGALDESTATTLAESLLSAEVAAGKNVARSIARAAEGMPLGIVELAKLVRDEATAGRTVSTIQTVDDAIRVRLSRLSAPAVQLLELVAVSEGPLPVRLARSALGSRAAEDTVAVLVLEEWLREESQGEILLLDVQHDRIREVVAGTLSVETRWAHHALLARLFEAEEPIMHERLAHHLERVGDHARAVEHTCRAADGAMRLLAFDRAARLWGRAVSLADDDERGRLTLLHVRSLVAAGRGADAAAAALPAAEGRTDADGRELRRLAAEGLLQTGRLESALSVYRSVARDEGISLPAGRARTAISLLAARLALAVRSFVPRGGDDETQRRRIDVLSALSTVLLLVDPLSGALVHSRRLLLALDHGDARQFTTALATEGAMLAAAGSARGKAMVADAHRRAQALGDSYATYMVHFAQGIVAYTEWRLMDAERALQASETVILAAVSGGSWELTTGRLFRYFSAIAAGRFRSALHDLSEHREDARRRRDLYATAVLGTAGAAFQHLADDKPEAAHLALDTALDGWPDEPFLMPHMLRSVTRAVVLLYEGRNDEAFAMALATHHRARRAGLLRHQINRARVDQLVACCAARIGDTRRARRHAHALLKHRLGGLAPAGHMVLGALAANAGDHRRAERALRLAVEGLASTEFAAWRAAACSALARFVAPTEAARLEAVADHWVACEGIVAPQRMYALFVPFSAAHWSHEEEST